MKILINAQTASSAVSASVTSALMAASTSSAIISVATEWFAGRHGRGFNNKDAWQRFGGGVAGATTYQILTLEHKF